MSASETGSDRLGSAPAPPEEPGLGQGPAIDDNARIRARLEGPVPAPAVVGRVGRFHGAHPTASGLMRTHVAAKLMRASRVHWTVAPVCVGRTFGIVAAQQIGLAHPRTVLRRRETPWRASGADLHATTGERDSRGRWARGCSPRGGAQMLSPSWECTSSTVACRGYRARDRLHRRVQLAVGSGQRQRTGVRRACVDANAARRRSPRAVHRG